jgi:hypothetical protein
MALIMFNDCSSGLSSASVEDFDGATGDWSWDAAAASGDFVADIVAHDPPSGTFLTWTHQCGAYNVSATFDDSDFEVALYYYDAFDGWQPAASVASGVDYLFDELPGDPSPTPLRCGDLLGVQVNGLNISAAGTVTVTVERF